MNEETVSPEEAPTAAPLAHLRGEQLGVVSFVMDYVELVFDGAKLSCYEWPSVELGGAVYRFGDRDYRNALCSLISRVVSDVAVVVDRQAGEAPVEREIRVHFGDEGLVRVSLLTDPGRPMEVAAYNDRDTSWLVW